MGTTRGTARLKTLNKGRPSSLLAIERPLLDWLLYLRHVGMPVSMNMVIVRASQLDDEFRRKTYTTRYSCARRLLRSKNIVIRFSTHESQRAPEEVQEEAKAFVRSVRPRLSTPNRDSRFILNMDQTPVFSFPCRRRQPLMSVELTPLTSDLHLDRPCA